MTFEPPRQPAAGWYPDPHVPGHERWWNGSEWVEAWNPPLDVAPFGGLPDIGDWLGRALRRMLRHWPAALGIAMLTSLLPSVLVWLGVGRLVDDLVITTDGDVVGWSAERVPVAIALGLVGVALYLVGTLALQALMLRSVDTQPAQGGDPPSHGDDLAAALRRGLAAVPRAIGWYLLLGLGALALAALGLGLALVHGALLALFIVAVIPFAIWLGVRLAFTNVAIVDAPGNPFSRSFDVVRGRWWPILGRLILIGLIGWVFSAAIQVITTLLGGGNAGGFGGNSFDIEVDADGTLTEDIVLADLFPTGGWALAITAIGGVVLAVVTSFGLAAMAELYRTRQPASGQTSAQ